MKAHILDSVEMNHPRYHVATAMTVPIVKAFRGL